MPIFALLMSGIFHSVFTFFLAYLGKKLASAMAAVAIFVGLVGTLYAALAAIMNGLVPLLPQHPAISLGVWLVITPVVPLCVAAAISADVAATLHQYNLRALGMARV